MLGLFLRYNDSTAEALGQWDPLEESSISRLYDAANGILMRINFHTARGAYDYDGYSRVTMQDITVDVTHSPWEYQAPEGQAAGTDQHIKTFDCYRPKQVCKSTNQRLDQQAYARSIYSELHGGLGSSTKTYLPITIGRKYA